jgi:photosystem II stability/assembly factor-like uncharacterized protein
VPIWRDVSEYNNRIDEVPNAVTMPLMGAVAAPGNLETGKAFIVGMGGHLREKDSEGTGWATAAGTVPGSPWRIRDVHFVSDTVGFQVGQFTRIAKTEDSGTTWDHAEGAPIFDTSPGGDGPRLNAITFADSSKGVTVGNIPTGGSRPVILRTTDAGATEWQPTDPATGFAMGPGGVADDLLDVASAGIIPSTGKADYWAAGARGFMLHSRDDGVTWTQFIPSSGQPTTFTIDGVAFMDLSTGIFVGTNGLAGRAFQWKREGGAVWTDLSPQAGTGVVEISDVVIAGIKAYAVGEKRVGGVRSGVVLASTFAGGSFRRFNVVAEPAGGFPLCLTNESANDLGRTPVLTEAEIHPATGDLWVGGQCGRVWKRTAVGAWTEFKSQTDTHILGISFGVDGSSVKGYFGGHRDEFPQGCVVRYQGSD